MGFGLTRRLGKDGFFNRDIPYRVLTGLSEVNSESQDLSRVWPFRVWGLQDLGFFVSAPFRWSASRFMVSRGYGLRNSGC